MNRAVPLDARMHLQSIRTRRFELPLSNPLVTGAGTFAARDVVLIELTAEIEGRVLTGWGEASPLPGWGYASPAPDGASSEVIPDDSVRSLTCPRAIDGIAGLDRALGSLDLRPVVRYGIETAVMDALARHAGVSLAACLGALRGGRRNPPPASVAVQYTLGSGSPAAARTALREAVRKGCRAAKLKVGAVPLRDDLVCISALVREFPSVRFRLDANGAWSLREAIEALESFEVELIEQPVAPHDFERLLYTIAELRRAKPAAHFPAIAADESCSGHGRALALIDDGRVDALVVKPSTLGGMLRACEVLGRARESGIEVIFSNLMESAAGRSAAAALAAAWPEFSGPHGLATGEWFETDVAPEPDVIVDGRLRLRNAAPGLGFTPRPEPGR